MIFRLTFGGQWSQKYLLCVYINFGCVYVYLYALIIFSLLGHNQFLFSLLYIDSFTSLQFLSVFLFAKCCVPDMLFFYFE